MWWHICIELFQVDSELQILMDFDLRVTPLEVVHIGHIFPVCTI